MKLPSELRSLVNGAKLAGGVLKAKLLELKREFVAPPIKERSRLVRFDGFGANPGQLQMRAYLPPVAPGRPLVVLLHGCGQDAGTFAMDSGWTSLADRLRFPLILPEQIRSNNAGRCFRWFELADTTRDRGEAASIAAMTRAAMSRFGSDPARIFIVGLSAGGAMAVALLATYPDLYTAGASVAGLPFRTATSGLQALLRMTSAGPNRQPEDWAALVRSAAPAGFNGRWPRLSIWQGWADRTVAPGNAKLLATQWRAVHGLPAPALLEQMQHGVQYQAWPDGPQSVVELWSLENLSHAYPTGSRKTAPGRFVERAPVDATANIARFFGLD
jgi:poly(hydroxyalkanoate) depolymerase family esterase